MNYSRHSFNDFLESGLASNDRSIFDDALDDALLHAFTSADNKYTKSNYIASHVSPGTYKSDSAPQINREKSMPELCLPLLLPSSASGPSDFQSSAISCQPLGVPVGHKSGLGIQFCNGSEQTSSRISLSSTTSATVNSSSAGCQYNREYLLGAFSHDSTVTGRNLDESNWDQEADRPLLFNSPVFMDAGMEVQHRFSDSFSLDSSTTLNDEDNLKYIHSSSYFENFSHLQSPPHLGLIADINMFDDNSMDSKSFVCPQDLFVSTEDTFDSLLKDLGSPCVSGETTIGSVSDRESPGEIEGLKAQLTSISTTRDTGSAILEDYKPSIGCQLPFAKEESAESTASFRVLGRGPFGPYERSNPVRKPRNKISRTPFTQRQGVNILEAHSTLPPRDVPLVNAFEGVSESEVAEKTAYYKLRHPGERLSDSLLFNFAGRLSESGEPICGYRCYITTCSKSTKRKDHMADHIRTHLGEKPFNCSICGLGFIRNNDCQRHENNHRPDKRFICDWCILPPSHEEIFSSGIKRPPAICPQGDQASLVGIEGRTIAKMICQ